MKSKNDYNWKEEMEEQDESSRQFDAFIRSEFHQHELPEIDRTALLNTLKQEAKRYCFHFSGMSFSWTSIRRLAFSTLGVLVLFFAWWALFSSVRLHDSEPVMEVEIVSMETGLEQDAPFFWVRRMQQGQIITIPEKTKAKLFLSDGSTLSCSSMTQIAIDFDHKRQIKMLSGSITVQAAAAKGSVFSVETPLGRVDVLGTVFHIDIR